MTQNQLINYNITTDFQQTDIDNIITPELETLLERCHQLALDGKMSSVQRLLDTIEKYPKNPQLKNYLSVLYGQIGDTKKMYETNRWIVSEHPNYLFGKLNLANEYYLKKEYHKMPEILGEAMEIKSLYPHRKTFHLDEVTSFLRTAILYFTAIGDIEQAEIRYNILEELAPDSEDNEIALEQMFEARMESGAKRFAEEQKSRISVETRNQEITTTTVAPKFANDEIEWLYTHGLYIGEEKLSALLSLPRESLISDLELVLQDSIERYTLFHESTEEEDWEEETMSFVVHAICLLGELESTKSIEVIFKVLSQSEDYLDFYLGDFLTGVIWEPIYKMANHNLEVCKQFIFAPGIYTYARTIFSDIVEQVALHQPERRKEAIEWFKEVIHFFLISKREENVIDSELIGIIVWTIIDIKGKELMPEVKRLFEKGIVSIGVCGDWDEVKKALERPDNHNKKREFLSISDRYNEITSTWAGYNEDVRIPSFDYDEPFESAVLPIRAEPKIGRNDPCPCGSGKKYKKCCLNK